jgi:hypothetical protein
MKITLHPARTALLAASLGLIPAHAFAAPGAVVALGPSHPGESASFAFTFDGKYGPKNGEHIEDTVSFKQTSADTIAVSAQKLKPLSLSTTRGGDGTFAIPETPSALGDVIADYDTAVKIAQHGAAGFHAGDAWQSQISLRTSPTTWQDVTVDVKVTRAAAGRTELEASGHREATLYFQGYTFPIDVTVHVSEQLAAHDKLASAQLEVNEVTAGGSGPPISYNWRLSSK